MPDRGRGTKLLIAEDDPFFRKLLEQILASDYELVLAENGEKAWAELQKTDGARLAILDWGDANSQ